MWDYFLKNSENVLDIIFNVSFITSIIGFFITYVTKIKSDKKRAHLENLLENNSEVILEACKLFSTDIFNYKNMNEENIKKVYDSILLCGSKKTLYLFSLFMQLSYTFNDNEKMEIFLKKEFFIRYFLFVRRKKRILNEEKYIEYLENIRTVLNFTLTSYVAQSLKKDLYDIKVFPESFIKCSINDFYTSLSTRKMHWNYVVLGLKCNTKNMFSLFKSF